MRAAKIGLKIIKMTMRLLVGLVCILAFVTGVLLLGLKALGWQTLVVQTGSMQEQYPVGTLLVVQPVEPETITVGDVVSYVADEALTVVTHRVVAIDEEQGYLITQGDENNTPDSEPVLFENLIGKVVIGIPVLGRALDWVHRGNHGIWLAGILALGVLAGVGYSSFVNAAQRRKRAAHEQDLENPSKQ